MFSHLGDFPLIKAVPATEAIILAHTLDYPIARFQPSALDESIGLGSTCDAIGLIPRLTSCIKLGPCIVTSEVISVDTIASRTLVSGFLTFCTAVASNDCNNSGAATAPIVNSGFRIEGRDQGIIESYCPSIARMTNLPARHD